MQITAAISTEIHVEVVVDSLHCGHLNGGMNVIDGKARASPSCRYQRMDLLDEAREFRKRNVGLSL